MSPTVRYLVSSSYKKRGCANFDTSSFYYRNKIYFRMKLVLEEVFYLLVGNHLLVEDVSTRLRALYHLDNLCVSATIL